MSDSTLFIDFGPGFMTACLADSRGEIKAESMPVHAGEDETQPELPGFAQEALENPDVAVLHSVDQANTYAIRSFASIRCSEPGSMSSLRNGFAQEQLTMNDLARFHAQLSRCKVGEHVVYGTLPGTDDLAEFEILSLACRKQLLQRRTEQFGRALATPFSRIHMLGMALTESWERQEGVAVALLNSACLPESQALTEVAVFFKGILLDIFEITYPDSGARDDLAERILATQIEIRRRANREKESWGNALLILCSPSPLQDALRIAKLSLKFNAAVRGRNENPSELIAREAIRQASRQKTSFQKAENA